MSLSALPDDMISSISFWLNGFDLCCLWMASDTDLRHKLTSSIITEFNIHYCIAGRYMWPGNFLEKLERLSRLSLVVDDRTKHLPIENIILHPIPTLKYFRIHCANAFDILSSSHPSTTIEGQKSLYIDVDLNELLNGLEHFEIKGVLPSRVGLPIEFIDCLPHHLKHLSVPYNYFELSEDENDNEDEISDYLQGLTHDLTSLEIRFAVLLEDVPCLDFADLPPNLTSLYTNINIDENYYEDIPQNIQHLKLEETAHNLEKLAPHLPIGLKSLSLWIHGDPIETLSRLEKLESLELSNSTPTSFFPILPANLKKLSYFHLRIPDLPTYPFPNCLKSFKLDRVVGISKNLIKSIPESVTELFLSSRHEQKSEPFAFFELLPKNLTSLSTDLHIIDNTSILPDSMTYLNLFSRYFSEKSCFDRFPEQLKFLRLIGNVTETTLTDLPKGLTSFGLTSKVCITDQVISRLPRTLLKLSLATASSLTDASASCFPPTLESLYLKHCQDWTDNSISKLPRSLQYLHLPGNTNFTDECVKHLPRLLIVLNLSGTRKITWKSSKHLPKYLSSLCLDSCDDWYPYEINDMPAFLQDFRVDSAAATTVWRQTKYCSSR